MEIALFLELTSLPRKKRHIRAIALGNAFAYLQSPRGLGVGLDKRREHFARRALGGVPPPIYDLRFTIYELDVRALARGNFHIVHDFYLGPRKRSPLK